MAVGPKAAAVPKEGRELLGEIRTELNVLIFTAIISLGFLKITEVSAFIALISSAINSKNIALVVVIVAAFIAYCAYALGILFGLFQTFSGKNPKPAMLVALASFFCVYFFVLMQSIWQAQGTLNAAPATAIAPNTTAAQTGRSELPSP